MLHSINDPEHVAVVDTKDASAYWKLSKITFITTVFITLYLVTFQTCSKQLLMKQCDFGDDGIWIINSTEWHFPCFNLSLISFLANTFVINCCKLLQLFSTFHLFAFLVLIHYRRQYLPDVHGFLKYYFSFFFQTYDLTFTLSVDFFLSQKCLIIC